MLPNRPERKSQQKQFLMKRVLAKRPIIQFRQLRTLRRDTVHSFSVYRRKKVQKEVSQSTDTNSPGATPETEFAKALHARITQQEQDVKQKHGRELETVEELKQQNELLKKQGDRRKAWRVRLAGSCGTCRRQPGAEPWKEGKKRTPGVLQKIGLPQIPMLINQQHVGAALNGSYKCTQQEILDHCFTLKEFATLPQKIADLIAIIQDKRTGKKDASSSVVDVNVEMTAKNGKQVLCAVQVGSSGHINGIRMDTNKVATVHGNADAIARIIDAIQENEQGNAAVYYINNKKTTNVIQRAGNPIPGGLKSIDGFVHSISEDASVVKSRHSGRLRCSIGLR